jgi:hypothetical protein
MKLLRSAPWWATPFLVLNLIAAAGTFVVLAGYGVLAVLLIGLILNAKALPEIARHYEEDPPAKAWDALWGFVAYRRPVPWLVRLAMIATAASVAGIVLAAGNAGVLSAEFAWGMLGSTAALALIESTMRHRHWSFQREAGWVLFEAAILALVALAFADGPHWVLALGAACGLEIVGFMVGAGVAAGRASEEAAAVAAAS